MKKNILYIIIDCFDKSKIGDSSVHNSPTPFLDSLKSHSFWVEHMYSQGPYTESALNATMCGHSTMDYGGYLKRYKNAPETLFQTMQRGNYEVYAQIWPHIHPESAFRGIDVLKLHPYSFNTLWVYRLSYYSELYKASQLDDTDWEDIIDFMDQNLSFWIKYYELLLAGAPEVDIILKYSTIGENLDRISEDLVSLRKQFEIYQNNKKQYISGLFSEGTNHILFTFFSEELLDHKIHKEGFVDKITTQYRDFINEAIKMSRTRNLKNTLLSPSKMHILFKQSESPLKLWKRTPFSQYLRNFYSLLASSSLKNQAAGNYDKQKDWISITAAFNEFEKWEESRSDDRPFFAYLHTDDIHGNGMLFDFCNEDENFIAAQMDRAKAYVANLPKNYRGSLEYDLAILNVDYQLEQIFKRLESKGLLENTAVIINSDHGCQTSYYPLRDLIQSFHFEGYNVPFILYDKDMTPKTDVEYRLTKDILPSLAEYIGVKPKPNVTGHSIFSDSVRDVVLQEYMGPGCPDMFRRNIWLCAFDHNWKVHIEASLNKPFSEIIIREIYNLKNDPLEEHNLVFNDFAKQKVKYLLVLLEDRWNNIKSNYSRTENYFE